MQHVSLTDGALTLGLQRQGSRTLRLRAVCSILAFETKRNWEKAINIGEPCKQCGRNWPLSFTCWSHLQYAGDHGSSSQDNGSAVKFSAMQALNAWVWVSGSYKAVRFLVPLLSKSQRGMLSDGAVACDVCGTTHNPILTCSKLKVLSVPFSPLFVRYSLIKAWQMRKCRNG